MSISEKGKDWIKFSNDVAAHIETYVVPQYGDKHEDECKEYTSADCLQQIKKYAARHGKNSRPGQDKLDLIKIAHYAQMAAEKLDDKH